MRRNIKTTVLAALLSLAMAGCSKTNQVVNYPETGGEAVSITFFGNKYEPENVIVIEKIISAFMKENPSIRVSYESLKGTDYYEALEKRIKAGKADDVFMVNHDLVLELQKTGNLADLSGLSTVPAYSEQMLSQMREDGNIYWLPTTVSVFGLYCNLDLLKKHNQKIPKNLGEWQQVCDYFLEQGITPIIANNDISLKTLAIGKGFYPVYQEKQQKEALGLLNQGKKKLSDYLEPGFSLAEGFLEKGYIDPQAAAVTKKTSDDLEEFVKGESPFMLTGAWAAGRVKGMNPDFSFQVIPYPALENGSFVVVNADTRLSVNAHSQNPEAAMKFVEYFTQPENIQRFADQQASLSPLKGGKPCSLEEIAPLLPCYESGQAVIGTDSQLNLPIWELTALVTEKLLAGEPLEDTMNWMDEQAAKEETGQW